MSDDPEPSWLTRHETASALGIGVHALAQWVADGYLPQPSLRGRGGGYYWRASAAAAALAAHQADLEDRLHLIDVAALLNVTVEAAKTRRRRGLLPPHDGHDNAGQWWHASTIASHLNATAVPDDAIRGVAAAAAFLGVPRATISLGSLPDPDGGSGATPWWRPTTLAAVTTHHSERLWTLDQATQHLGVSVEELPPTDTMPTPVAVNPPRWRPAHVRRWWKQHRESLHTNPDVLFSTDLPTLTGLSYDTIRTYNAKGKLPRSDGTLRGRPWWHRSTITTWIATRPLGAGGRPPLSRGDSSP